MNKERLMQILLAPVVSEKAVRAGEQKRRQAVFKVRKDATKYEIKCAVEFLFNVTVKSVRTIVMKGKACRFGQHEGRHSDWKKAYVELKEGDDINLGGVN